MSDFLKPSDMGWDDGYLGVETPSTDRFGPRPDFVSPSDVGLSAVSKETGAPVRTPEELGYYPEELETGRRYLEEQRGDPRSVGQMISDSPITKAIRYAAPEVFGGEGKLRVSEFPGQVRDIAMQLPGQILQAGKEAVLAPYRMMSGEVPMFDASGRPREAAIAESLKFSSLVPAGRIGSGLGLSEAAARGRIASSIAKDVEMGKIRGLDRNRPGQYGPRVQPGATADELAILSDEGIPVTGYDLSAGEFTQKLVEDAAQKARDKSPAVRLKNTMAERSRDAGLYVSNTIDNIAGKKVASGEEFQAAVEAIENTNKPAYNRVMGLPEHQSIFSPAIKDILESRPVFRGILKDRAAGSENRGNQPPSIYGPRGKLDIQPYNAPSLEYLDEVYRRVREMGDTAYENGDSVTGKDYKTAANDLRAALDAAAVKDADGKSTYKSIRDDASGVFGAKNALEAGYKFPRSADPMKLQEINSAYKRYTPEQKEQFRIGLLANVKDEVLGGRINKVVSWFDGTNPKMYEKMEGILGPDATLRLSNQVKMQKIVNEGVPPTISEAVNAAGGGGGKGALKLGAGAGLALGGQELLQSLPQIANIIQHPLTVGAAGAIGVGGAAWLGTRLLKSANTAYEARVSQEVLNAISSRNPSLIAALEKHPPSVLRTVLDRVSSFAQRSGGLYAAGEAMDAPSSEIEFAPRVERKSGGRIGPNSISAEVRKVRALLSQKTASMLSMPDDAIATALHIAKGK